MGGTKNLYIRCQGSNVWQENSNQNASQCIQFFIVYFAHVVHNEMTFLLWKNSEIGLALMKPECSVSPH